MQHSVFICHLLLLARVESFPQSQYFAPMWVYQVGGAAATYTPLLLLSVLSLLEWDCAFELGMGMYTSTGNGDVHMNWEWECTLELGLGMHPSAGNESVMYN